ncbi:hypothetical protein FAES_3283 [Fibrella aestuarina BUZ 2]|uniref:PRTRC system protein B n=1 Tax=Fibrella aestuarina BUZ 2 TaxID=1166018 RepID=I0KAY9_9BACT|nr:hypothetical protein [Fibrella aestuarina]CCH01292.1 hypothetical protein FAES_3283 [Fibrella aestuarina BUZ 2]
MENVNKLFLDFAIPKFILLFYQQPNSYQQDQDDDGSFYVESCDIDPVTGLMRNHHPLAVEESQALGKRLNASHDRITGFLLPKGLLPENVLYLNPRGEGKVIWYTKPGKRTLYFSDYRKIKDGTAHVPGLLWCATATTLRLFALKPGVVEGRPASNTQLYYAPFYNTNSAGEVCQGDVDIDVTGESTLEDFITGWERFYFDSRFSHLSGNLPIKGNLDELWNSLIGTETPFPHDLMISTKLTLKDLLA